MVGQEVSERFKLTNPFKVPCTVELDVKARELVSSKVHNAGYNCLCAAPGLEPPGLASSLRRRGAYRSQPPGPATDRAPRLPREQVRRAPSSLAHHPGGRPPGATGATCSSSSS